jgi:hypothetical protein
MIEHMRDVHRIKIPERDQVGGSYVFPVDENRPTQSPRVPGQDNSKGLSFKLKDPTPLKLPSEIAQSSYTMKTSSGFQSEQHTGVTDIKGMLKASRQELVLGFAGILLGHGASPNPVFMTSSLSNVAAIHLIYCYIIMLRYRADTESKKEAVSFVEDARG